MTTLGDFVKVDKVGTPEGDLLRQQTRAVGRHSLIGSAHRDRNRHGEAFRVVYGTATVVFVVGGLLVAAERRSDRILEAVVAVWYLFTRESHLKMNMADLLHTDSMLNMDYIRITAPMMVVSGLWGLNTAMQNTISLPNDSVIVSC